MKPMRLLVLTGELYPIPGNNTNLLFKLLPYLARNCEVRVLSTAVSTNAKKRPSRFKGVPVYWISRDAVSSGKQKLVFPAVSKVFDPNGNSDVLNLLYIEEAIKHIRREYSFDAILSSSEPYPASAAAAMQKAKRVLYLMDPPELVRNEKGTRFRNRNLNRILSAQDAILTTPFIRDALLSHGMNELAHLITPVGFPMVEESARISMKRTKGHIRLLFSGWMCSQLRSPRYFLDIVSRLDQRFEVTFMGKECELLQKRFPIETKATIVTLPNQPYETALQAMADADVLINIGNSVPVHMPSKTLEYINTGKPIVNFYKFADCPTLYYTERYPLALNLFEEEKDLDAVTERFIRFCEENNGKTVDRMFIEAEYADCTPQYIAQKILECLEK